MLDCMDVQSLVFEPLKLRGMGEEEFKDGEEETSKVEISETGTD